MVTNNTKAERNITLSYSMDEIVNAIKKTAAASTGIYQDFNDVLHTYSFTVSKSIMWVAKYTIQLTTNADGTINMFVTCTGAHNGTESNAQLESFISEMLNLFSSILSGKMEVSTISPEASKSANKLIGICIAVIIISGIILGVCLALL